MSEHGSRSNKDDLPESVIEVVQIDALVMMNLVKHCHGVNIENLGVAQGTLLGLVADSRLEITHSFPFPLQVEESLGDEEFQSEMMRKLRMVNVDHLIVGWYQSANFGNYFSPQLLESHFAYQTSIEESVCLIYDTGKNNKGFLSVKAFRLKPMALKLYKEGEITFESAKNMKLSHDNLFEEVPIRIKNSFLVNELLLELGEHVPVEEGTQFLDLGYANILEDQLKVLTETVDELNQDTMKFNRYQLTATKQCQEKARYIQKRQVENNARTVRGEDALPEEDINKLFNPIPPPSRLNSLIMAGQSLSTAENVSQFCTQALGKLFISEALQKTKAEVDGNN